VIDGAAPLITLLLADGRGPPTACCLRLSEARRLAGDLLAAAAALEGLS